MTQPISKKVVKSKKRGPKKAEELRRLKKEVVCKLRAGCSYTKTAEKLGIERNSIKKWRDTDEQFLAACEYAREMAIERVEDALYEAALKVVENSRYTTAAIFFLKNRAPKPWRDVQNVRQTNDIQKAVDSLTPDQLTRMASNLEVNLGQEKAESPAAYPTVPSYW